MRGFESREGTSAHDNEDNDSDGMRDGIVSVEREMVTLCSICGVFGGDDNVAFQELGLTTEILCNLLGDKGAITYEFLVAWMPDRIWNLGISITMW